MGFPGQEYWSELPFLFPSPGDFPNPGTETASPALQADFLLLSHPLSSAQSSCSVVSDSATPWTAAHQASLSTTNYWSLLNLMSINLVMPSNHFILCCPFLLLPSFFPSIRVFSSESVLLIRWPKYWSFSFSLASVLSVNIQGTDFL